MNHLEISISILRSAFKDSPVDITTAHTSHDVIISLQQSLPITDIIAQWYKLAAPVDFEIPWASEWLSLFPPANLAECQVGYRWIGSISGEEDTEWNPNWLVIGNTSGNPIIADTNFQETPILMAEHGCGSWDPLRIAPCLPDFLLLLATWINTYEEYAGCTRNDDGEIDNNFSESLSRKLKRFMPPSCIDNIYTFIC